METAHPTFPAEPAWPACEPDRLVVFLLDASSPLEREMLEDWIKRSHPSERPPGKVRVLAIPPTRRRSKSPLDPGLEALLAGDEDPLFAPLRVAWLAPRRDGTRVVRLRDLLTFGDPRDPGRLRQRVIRARHPDRCVIVAAEPARASALRARWTEAGGRDGGATTGLAEFVARQAALALERAERRIRGARYKVPRLLDEEILGSPGFRGRLAQLAREEGRSDARILREAHADLREIAATHSPLVIDLAARLIRLLYTQGYAAEIQYDREQLAGIAGLSQRHPVVFLPTHKSNLDHLVLQYMLYENGLPPNHTAGGINMNFFPVGPLVRRSGVFFIRRSFRDDPVYKLVLRHYIDYLIEKRFSLEWYIEGGRSRSGKLLPPRFGMLAYVVDAWRRHKCDDVHLIPVSIAYDQIQEVGGYSDEQRGAAKERESFAWFVRMIRALRRRYGRIHVRFGEPVSLAAQLGPPSGADAGDPDERDIALQKLAFEVAVRINRATPITPTSLVTLALLGTGDTALTVAQTRRGLANLLRYVQERKLPTSAQLFHLNSDEGIERTLEALVDNGVVSRFDGGSECVYLIGPDQQLAAAYYRNTIIHFFVGAAIAELAVVKVSEDPGPDPTATFFAEAMRLRDLLKFEFFFTEKEQFREEIREEIAFHDAEWEARLAEAPGGALTLIRSFRPFTAHRVLRPFLESYRVFADALVKLEGRKDVERGALIETCLGLGKQYQL
ncbi:MAG TPA: glycerol-3-phosphate 1-O-acyltransferase, partial [Alphaproteobacteria bacterium]|nr:glycerol-3-phosphate 1-O-acyltransferase [Alphaproteobacteria bacterium]